MSRVKNFLFSLSVVALIILIIWHLGYSAQVLAKAELAEVLIDRAWQASLESPEEIQRPWPWADTWPVMELEYPEQKALFHVLSGSTGNVLAFAPGLMPESGMPGAGPILVAGHRDTHFNALQNAAAGQLLHLRNRDGEEYIYEIEELTVIDITKDSLVVSEDDTSLYLVTCYPFGAVAAGGDQRMVVRAEFKIAVLP